MKYLKMDWADQTGLLVEIEQAKSNDRPLYRHVLEYPNRYEYAAYGGYYQFYKSSGKVFLDDGTALREVTDKVEWRVVKQT